MIMMQLQRPCSFHPLPHQQQFQHLLRCSKGHRGRVHLGSRGLDAAVDGLPWKLGGSGYAMDWLVRLRHGRRLIGELLLLSFDDDSRCFFPWSFFDDDFDDFDEELLDDDSMIGASAQ